jgi:hypothetical protein
MLDDRVVKDDLGADDEDGDDTIDTFDSTPLLVDGTDESISI